jgi:phage I-like protein
VNKEKLELEDLDLMNEAQFQIDESRQHKRRWVLWKRLFDRFVDLLAEKQVREQEFKNAVNLFGWEEGEARPQSVIDLVLLIQAQAQRDLDELNTLRAQHSAMNDTLMQHAGQTKYTIMPGDLHQLFRVVTLTHDDEIEELRKNLEAAEVELNSLRKELVDSRRAETTQYKSTLAIQKDFWDLFKYVPARVRAKFMAEVDRQNERKVKPGE